MLGYAHDMRLFGYAYVHGRDNQAIHPMHGWVLKRALGGRWCMSTSQCAPLACELDSRLLPAGVAPAGRPLLTVIVPVFNEAATIDELLRRISESGYVEQVIVVDDGSTDGTQTILERRSSRGEIELYRHEMNRGKGAAVRTALDHARGEYTIVQDGDLEYDPQDYPALLGPLMRREAAALYV
jgi:cellulose synthase/poly-beta-1,6-N-acetylglucosamine synthase-like glycosyltransferase